MKVFLDTADPQHFLRRDVDGFTTNPTLMRRHGVTDYLEHCQLLVKAAGDLPVSLEVLADDWKGIEYQACNLANLGENVYVKVPVSNTTGASASLVLVKLANRGIRLNVTCVTSSAQAKQIVGAMGHGPMGIVSVFAGRIADAGADPAFIVEKVVKTVAAKAEVLWASTREAYNFCQAEQAGADIITLTPDLLTKVRRFGKTLGEISLESVRQFAADGQGYRL